MVGWSPASRRTPLAPAHDHRQLASPAPAQPLQRSLLQPHLIPRPRQTLHAPPMQMRNDSGNSLAALSVSSPRHTQTLSRRASCSSIPHRHRHRSPRRRGASESASSSKPQSQEPQHRAGRDLACWRVPTALFSRISAGSAWPHLSARSCHAVQLTLVEMEKRADQLRRTSPDGNLADLDVRHPSSLAPDRFGRRPRTRNPGGPKVYSAGRRRRLERRHSCLQPQRSWISSGPQPQGSEPALHGSRRDGDPPRAAALATCEEYDPGLLHRPSRPCGRSPSARSLARARRPRPNLR